MARTSTLRLTAPVEVDPPEAVHQEQVMKIAALHEAEFPTLKLLHHVPNGGHRAKSTAAALKKQGVKSGVPDLCLPVARGGYHGLYVEMKRFRDSYPTEEQKQWIAALTAEGYRAVVCRGWRIAWAEIHAYLNLSN